MFKCVWCKKEDIAHHGWTEHKEPLCLRCDYKYQFGLKQKLISGRVADLSKEQRRIVGERLNNYERFWGALNSVRREELTGRFDVLSKISKIFILIAPFILVSFIDVDRWLATSGMLIICLFYYVLLADRLGRGFIWWLKFFQLKSKIENSGYYIGLYGKN